MLHEPARVRIAGLATPDQVAPLVAAADDVDERPRRNDRDDRVVGARTGPQIEVRRRSLLLGIGRQQTERHCHGRYTKKQRSTENAHSCLPSNNEMKTRLRSPARPGPPEGAPGTHQPPFSGYSSSTKSSSTRPTWSVEVYLNVDIPALLIVVTAAVIGVVPVI